MNFVQKQTSTVRVHYLLFQWQDRQGLFVRKSTFFTWFLLTKILHVVHRGEKSSTQSVSKGFMATDLASSVTLQKYPKTFIHAFLGEKLQADFQRSFLFDQEVAVMTPSKSLKTPRSVVVILGRWRLGQLWSSLVGSESWSLSGVGDFFLSVRRFVQSWDENTVSSRPLVAWAPCRRYPLCSASRRKAGGPGAPCRTCRRTTRPQAPGWKRKSSASTLFFRSWLRCGVLYSLRYRGGRCRRRGSCPQWWLCLGPGRGDSGPWRSFLGRRRTTPGTGGSGKRPSCPASRRRGLRTETKKTLIN